MLNFSQKWTSLPNDAYRPMLIDQNECTIFIFSEEGLEITIQTKIHMSIPKMRMIHDEDENMNMIR